MIANRTVAKNGINIFESIREPPVQCDLEIMRL